MGKKVRTEGNEENEGRKEEKKKSGEFCWVI